MRSEMPFDQQLLFSAITPRGIIGRSFDVNDKASIAATQLCPHGFEASGYAGLQRLRFGGAALFLFFTDIPQVACGLAAGSPEFAI